MKETRCAGGVVDRICPTRPACALGDEFWASCVTESLMRNRGEAEVLIPAVGMVAETQE